jgi:hypothetical protein
MEKYSIEVANLDIENREVRKPGSRDARKPGSRDARKPFFLNIPNCFDIFNSRWLGDYVVSIPDLKSVICCDTLRI